MRHAGGMSRKGDEVRIVIHRDGLCATALWARWRRAKDGRADVFYGRNHNEVVGQYLRASYHGSGEQPQGLTAPLNQTFGVQQQRGAVAPSVAVTFRTRPVRGHVPLRMGEVIPG